MKSNNLSNNKNKNILEVKTGQYYIFNMENKLKYVYEKYR